MYVFLYPSDEESGGKGDMDDKQSGLPSPAGGQNSSSGGKFSKRGKRRVRALDDSDEDDTGLDNVIQNGDKSGEGEDDEGANKENTEAVKKAATSDRDDDDDDDDLEYSRNISDIEDVNNNADKNQSEAGKKRPRDDNDDESSDDDEEFNLPLNFHKKARRVLVDDDDDED